jgi:hypothetical protein
MAGIITVASKDTCTGKVLITDSISIAPNSAVFLTVNGNTTSGEGIAGKAGNPGTKSLINRKGK